MMYTFILLLAVTISSQGGSAAEDKIRGDVTCDNEMWFYADGVLKVKNDDWTKATPVSLDIDTKVLAFKCVDHGVIGGIKAAFDYGMKTDSSWKCTTDPGTGMGLEWTKEGFDDSTWSNAVVVTDTRWGTHPAKLNGKADWIWTSGYKGQDTTVYCRKETEIKGHVTCDNRMRFYADGEQKAFSRHWKYATAVTLPVYTKVLAFKCTDFGVIAGIKGAFNNGKKTDGSWKCTADKPGFGWNKAGFDDSSWSNAVVVTDPRWGNQPPELNGKADWIWTDGYKGEDKLVYCRKEIN